MKIENLKVYFTVITVFVLIVAIGFAIYKIDFQKEENFSKPKITLWHTFSGREKETFNKIIQRYIENHSDIIIDYQPQDYSAMIQKYITAASAGDAPDIIRIPNDRLGEVAIKGFLETLNPFLTPELSREYFFNSLSAMTFENSLYGLPASQDTLMLVYNKDIFSSKNIPFPNRTWTTQTLIDVAVQLTDDEHYGLVFPVTSSYWWFPFLIGYGGTIFDSNGEPAINSLEAQRATSYVMDMIKKYNIMPSTVIDEVKMVTLFQEQKAAMIMIGPWKIEEIRNAAVNYGLEILPIVTETGKRLSPLVGYKGYSISKNSLHKDKAFDLIKYLTSDEVTLQFALETKTMPSKIRVMNNPTVLANEVLYIENEQVKYGTPFPSSPRMIVVGEKVGEALEKILNGADIQTALDEAQRRIIEY